MELRRAIHQRFSPPLFLGLGFGLEFDQPSINGVLLTQQQQSRSSFCSFAPNINGIGAFHSRALFLQPHFWKSKKRFLSWTFRIFVVFFFLIRFKSRLRLPGLGPQAMSTSTQGTASSRSVGNLENEPDHLLVLVHGIMASPRDWTYFEAELKTRLGRNFLIYASSSNTFTKTFIGIDGAGKRLADEVLQVVKKTESLKRISFLAHSLGGLFARYAIAVLYNNSNTFSSTQNDPCNSSKRGVVAGLEPISFITLASPHLGVRGKKQLPFLLGLPFLEKLALPIAPIVVGRTGSQLFLTDGEPDKPSLLFRMASDCEEGRFISVLGAFQSRILYANVAYDHMVGWRTSSIRRENELIKPRGRSLDGYKHVVDVEYYPPVSSAGPHFPPEAAQAKEAAQNSPTTHNTLDYQEIMEEEMIRGLQQLGWKKIDVSFHSSFWPFFAHNNILVKNEWLYNAGAGVVAHVADTLKQQEPSSLAAPMESL